MKEASLYEKLGENRVRCNLCAHRCLIQQDKTGVCGVRENIGGTLFTHAYGKTISANIDPMEKKPLFHFLPGTPVLSIATTGCNFKCLHCQNSDISQTDTERILRMGNKADPESIVDLAESRGCQSIAYTYTEPTIFFEYAFETARLAHGRGLRNVFVTNGYMTEEALDEINPYLDAANVDLKGFSEKFYKTVCGGSLEPVLDTLRRMVAKGIWVEVTTLVIPGYNDSLDELRSVAEFIRRELGAQVPWHISRFHPSYRLTDVSSTPLSIMSKAREMGIECGLKYVYTGNVPGGPGENTLCSGCGRVVVERRGFEIRNCDLEGSRCRHCNTSIDGVFK